MKSVSIYLYISYLITKSIAPLLRILKMPKLKKKNPQSKTKFIEFGFIIKTVN